MEPSAAESPHQVASEPRNGAVPSTAAPRILLVDGDPVRSRYTALLLQRICGTRPRVLTDGGEALEQACDLLLLDMDAAEAGGGDGLHTLRALAQRPGWRPIVAISAAQPGPDRASCLAAGADDHLYRPVTRHSLAEALRRAGWGGAAPDDFNAATWAELLRAFKPAGVAELAAALAADAPLQRRLHAQAAAAGDLNALARIAHAVRGASLQLGAEALAGLSAQAESAAAAGEREAALPLAAEMLARYGALVERLGRQVSNGGATAA